MKKQWSALQNTICTLHKAYRIYNKTNRFAPITKTEIN